MASGFPIFGGKYGKLLTSNAAAAAIVELLAGAEAEALLEALALPVVVTAEVELTNDPALPLGNIELDATVPALPVLRMADAPVLDNTGAAVVNVNAGLVLVVNAEAVLGVGFMMAFGTGALGGPVLGGGFSTEVALALANAEAALL